MRLQDICRAVIGCLCAGDKGGEDDQPLVIFGANPGASAGNQVEVGSRGGAKDTLDDGVVWAAIGVVESLDVCDLEREYLARLFGNADVVARLNLAQVPEDGAAAVVAIHMPGQYGVARLAGHGAVLPPEGGAPDRVTGRMSSAGRFHCSILIFPYSDDRRVHTQAGYAYPDWLAEVGGFRRLRGEARIPAAAGGRSAGCGDEECYHQSGYA